MYEAAKLQRVYCYKLSFLAFAGGLAWDEPTRPRCPVLYWRILQLLQARATHPGYT